MKPNLLQRIGGAIMAAGWSWSGGYTGGTGGWGGSKFTGATVYPSLAGLDHATLRAKTRKAYWESPDARAIEGRIVNSTINWGLMLEASPSWDIIDPDGKITAEARRAWKKKVQALYGLWMNSMDLDAAGRKTGYQLQGFNFSNKVREGETWIICRYSRDARLLCPLRLQFVNPDQIHDPLDGAMLAAVKARGNYIVDGVEIDDAGREIAIFVWSDPLTYQTPIRSPYMSTCARIPKYGTKSRRPFFLHPALTDEVGQVRGIPLLAHVVHELQKILDYKLAELESAVINAIFAATVTPGPNVQASKAMAGIGVRSTVQQADDAADGITREGIANKPGIVLQTLKAGEKFESFDTKRPNVNYQIFHDCLLEEISTSVGVPLEVVKVKFGQSYSAMRGIMQVFWNQVYQWRYDQAAEFDNIIYETAMAEWVGSNVIEAEGFETSELIRRAWLNCEWTGITMPSMNPTDDAKAADLRIAAGSSTRERESILYNGSDYEENVARLADENRKLAEANKSLQPPAPVAPGTPDMTPDQMDQQEKQDIPAKQGAA
jgi:lambda family phage portal protein